MVSWPETISLDKEDIGPNMKYSPALALRLHYLNSTLSSSHARVAAMKIPASTTTALPILSRRTTMHSHLKLRPYDLGQAQVGDVVLSFTEVKS